MSTNNEMPDANDSSGFLDDTHSEFTAAGGRPKGSTLRPRSNLNLTECAADYADLFRALQIRPGQHERFLDGILKILRQKHIKELQKGTDASIRGLTRLVLRGYRTIVWSANSEFLLKDEELDEGEERLLAGEDNERFYPLLEPVWWRMRDLVFEVKAPLKVRVSSKKGARPGANAEDAYEVSTAQASVSIPYQQTESLRQPGHLLHFNAVLCSPPRTRLTFPTGNAQADADTELDIRPAPHDRAKEQTLRKLDKLIAAAPEPSCRNLSADETDQAIVNLIVQLADTRARSDPAVFQRIWDQHVGRIDEVENTGNGDPQQVDAATTTTSSAPPKTMIPNLSNAPFATAGNPLPQSWPPPLPPQLPATMALYITTSPPEPPYTDRAYEWLDAPVRMVDQRAFYDGVMLRVSVRAERVRGFVMSYGWCDVCRWVPRGDAVAERDGWDVLQRDLAWAAGRRVRVWRMKVLVVGC